jgi:hypothetical protein
VLPAFRFNNDRDTLQRICDVTSLIVDVKLACTATTVAGTEGQQYGIQFKQLATGNFQVAKTSKKSPAKGMLVLHLRAHLLALWGACVAFTELLNSWQENDLFGPPSPLVSFPQQVGMRAIAQSPSIGNLLMHAIANTQTQLTCPYSRPL